jgi:hypothetical protein
MNTMASDDYTAWCDTHLPDLFDPGLFDDEETTEETMDVVQQQFQETVLDLMDVEDTTAEEREAMTDAALEAAETWFKVQKAAIVAAIEPLPATLLKQITTREQVAQHSADWYAQRRNRLTASEFAQILDGRRGALLRQKIAPASEAADSYGSTVALAQEDGAMTPFSWGHRFEPIVRAIYEQEIAGPEPGTVNDSLGRFSHRSIPYLSASPDGIVMTGALAGRLLEIKAPKSRQPGTFVPYEYYVQMQIQMEVTDLEAVDFIEAKFQQRHVGSLSPEDEVALVNAAWKGRIQVVSSKDGALRYIYSVPSEDLDDATLKVPQEGEDLIEDTIWWLVALYPRTVLRNPEWWSSTGQPAAAAFWVDVEAGRTKAADTIELVPPSPKWRGSTSKVLNLPDI